MFQTHFAHQRGLAGPSLLLLPGVTLMLFGVAILLWPELLAYLVAGFMILVGGLLTGWAWSARRRRPRMPRQSDGVVYYEVHQ